MTKTSTLPALKTLGLALLTVVMTRTASRAQTLDPIMPRLSYSKALYFQRNPEAWRQFMLKLPRRPAGPPQARPPGPLPPLFGGSWATVAAAPEANLTNPMLLTDGTVIVHVVTSATWYRLTPDNTGSYINGTWSQIASLPSRYGPRWFASQVLPDGRAIINGGEYNLSGGPVWTNLGAIYDPLADLWTAVAPPNGWSQIGDAPSVVLPNGTYMLGSCCGQVAGTSGPPILQSESEGPTLTSHAARLLRVGST